MVHGASLLLVSFVVKDGVMKSFNLGSVQQMMGTRERRWIVPQAVSIYHAKLSVPPVLIIASGKIRVGDMVIFGEV